MPLNTKIANEQWERYVYCRDTGHMAYIAKAEKCDAFFRGCQWDQTVLSELREQRRPGLTINKVLGTLSSIMGEQIDLRTEIAFRARYGAPSGNADMFTKLFRFISDQNQLNWVRSELFADGAITSRGYVDVRMDYAHSVTGDVRVTNLNPKNVLPDPDAAEYDPDEWNDVFTTRWLSCDDIECMYTKADADLLRNRSDGSWAYGYDSVEQFRDRFGGDAPQQTGTESNAGIAKMIRVVDRQYRKLAKIKYFVDLKTGTRKCIPEDWDQNRINATLAAAQGQMVVDTQVGRKIRWCVTADDVVLKDEWSPYRHFTVIPYFPYFRYGKTIGLVENLIDPQELLNKTTSQELHVVNTMANSGWKIKKGVLSNMTPDELEIHGAQTGLVLEVDGDPDKDVVKIQPNQIPQGLDRLSVKGENYIKTVSMRGDAQLGMTRADVSADQIEANKASSDVGLRKPMDNLERTDYLLARAIRDLVQDNYTDPRIMNITHNALTGEQQEVTINWPDPTTGELMNDVTMGEYDITVVSQPVKQTLEQSQFDQGVMLREKLGIPIPDEFLLQNSNLINKTGIIAALKAQAATPEAQTAKQVQNLAGQLQVAELKGKVTKEESTALAQRAKAAKTVAETHELMNGDPTGQQEMELEQQKAEQEMQIEREKMALKAQEHAQEMQFKREEFALDMELKAKEAAEKRRTQRAEQILKLKQAATTTNGAPGPAGAGGKAKPAAGASA